MNSLPAHLVHLSCPALPVPPSWFPGHMNRFTKQLPSMLSRTHVVIEVRDARLPLTSINRKLQGECNVRFYYLRTLKYYDRYAPRMERQSANEQPNVPTCHSSQQSGPHPRVGYPSKNVNQSIRGSFVICIFCVCPDSPSCR